MQSTAPQPTEPGAREPERRLIPAPPPGGWLSDEPQMETYKHLMQMLALIVTLRWIWRERRDYFVGGNLTIYFSPRQKKSEDLRGPDFFVVLDVDGTRERNSWVVWEEGGRYPNVILEILSHSTEHVDRGEKKRIYQDVFRTPEYFLFDPESLAFEGHRLVAGRYEPMLADAAGRLVSEQLGLRLGVEGGEVRFFALDGSPIPRPEEEALTALRRVEEEKRRAEEAKRRAEEEKRRAEEEKRRADAAVAELAELRAALRRGEP
jgi:Uma2 family endonuclease